LKHNVSIRRFMAVDGVTLALIDRYYWSWITASIAVPGTGLVDQFTVYKTSRIDETKDFALTFLISTVVVVLLEAFAVNLITIIMNKNVDRKVDHELIV